MSIDFKKNYLTLFFYPSRYDSNEKNLITLLLNHILNLGQIYK